MSRKHTTKTQQRGNGWMDPRGTREAHETRNMEKRSKPLMRSAEKVGKRAFKVTKRRKAK